VQPCQWGARVPYRQSFNPHPSRRTGATTWLREVPAQQLRLSILTRPEGRVQREVRNSLEGCPWVSILTRPEGRVQREVRNSLEGCPWVSILTRPEGRVQRTAPESAA